jgi:hypothetical protein
MGYSSARMASTERAASAFAAPRALAIATRARAAVPVSVAAVASIAYGLTFGFTYGVNNQVGYMLASLRLLDPSVLAHDWYSNTLNYHPAFAYLGWLLLAVGGRGGWGIGVAGVVAASVGAMSVYALARRLLPAEIHLASFLFVLVAMLTTGTREMASTYAFDPIFQPSMVASAALLASLAPFVAGRYLLSGILLAVGGLFHVNFLILGLAAFGVAHLLLGREGFRDRVLRHLGPSVLVALLLSPVILRGVGGADAARAQQILFEIRSPHHYRPRGYIADFFPFLAWQALGLGLGGWVLRASQGRGRRFGAVVVGLLAVVWLGSFGAVVLDSRRVTQLFVWRFAPYVDILMQLLVAASAARLLFTPRAPSRLSRASLGLTLAGGAGLAVSVATRDPATVSWVEEMAVLSVAGAALRAGLPFAARARSRVPASAGKAAPWIASALGVVALVAAVKEPLSSVRNRSNLLTGMPGAETDLYAWLRANTPKDATVLSPPGLERFRLASERAIVVDWKASTYAPSELVEWYHRLEDVSGRPGLRGRDDVVAGYDAMDRARLDALRQKYHLSYAVVGRGREGPLGHRPVYTNAQFAVLDLTN